VHKGPELWEWAVRIIVPKVPDPGEVFCCIKNRTAHTRTRICELYQGPCDGSSREGPQGGTCTAIDPVTPFPVQPLGARKTLSATP